VRHLCLVGMGRKPKKRRNSYGAWLLYLRVEKGLTQAEAAKLIGVPRTTLMHWERTGNLTGRKHIIKLAGIYGVSVQKFLRVEKFPK
jgi:transcriptional regulator with XRE-family HTH domain